MPCVSETKTYQGGCHCGNVRYEVEMELGEVITCNCSICSKTGTMLAFVPAPQFKLLSGDEHLTDYLFNKQTIHHLFCDTCGIRSFARGSMPDGSPIAAVNVRCLDDVDLSELKQNHYDGKNM